MTGSLKPQLITITTMELNNLKKKIPYQWRVQSYSKNKAQATCVAYIDARDVMELLDEVCGPENWQSDFRDVGGQVFGGIGIRNSDKEWVWKWDTGTESNVEKEKGQASDAFKRAAVKWGIGRFLYDLDVAYVKTDGPLSDSHKFPHVVDDNGNRVWDLTKHLNGGWKQADAVPVAPRKPVPPKQVANSRDALKKRIKELADEIAIVPLLSKADYENYCLEVTGYELTEENYPAIIDVLEGIKLKNVG